MLMEEGSDDSDDLLTAATTCVMSNMQEDASMTQNAMQWTSKVMDILRA